MIFDDLKLSVRAKNMLWWTLGYPTWDKYREFGLLPVEDVRQRLIEKAGSEPSVHRWCMMQKNCGRLTATDIVRALGITEPREGAHCPTCTCGKERR